MAGCMRRVRSLLGSNPEASLAITLLLFWCVALLMAMFQLGNLPLRDFDEGTVAQVALELSRRPWPEKLLPTIWGDPYLNKPPGLHGLIAVCISAWRWLSGAAPGVVPPEWLVRLAPALISTIVVPLSGCIQWQLRPRQTATAVCTAAVALSLLPVVRHGRLAMLDGSLLSAMALLWLAMLRWHKGSGVLWPLLAGAAASAMLLLKAPLLIPAIAAGLLPLALDGWRQSPATTRPLPGPLPWLVFTIGLMPGLSWHGWHVAQRGLHAALHMWVGDGVGRVLLTAGPGSDLGWRVPLIEMLEGGWPWLVVWPLGMVLAWQQRRSLAGCWCLCSYAVLAAAIVPLKTQLPWYSHSLWLPFALICGPALAELIHGRQSRTRFAWHGLLSGVPWSLLVLAGALLTLALAGSVGGHDILSPYAGFAVTAGCGWGIGGLLLRQGRARQRCWGLLAITIGSLAVLLQLLASPLWLWELNHSWPVKPAVALMRSVGATNVRLMASGQRPSLSWYAGEKIPASEQATPTGWVLGSRDALETAATHCETVGGDADWQLRFC